MSTADVYELARQLNALKERLDGQKTPSLAFSTIEAGAVTVVDEYDGLRGSVGVQFDGAVLAQEFNGPEPLTPSQPYADADVAGAARIRWDGLWADGDVVPSNFTRVEIHIQQDTEPAGDVASTIFGTFETPRGGEQSFALPPGTYFVALVARNASGARGPRSLATQVVVAPIVADTSQIEADVAAAQAAAAAAQTTADQAKQTGADALTAAGNAQTVADAAKAQAADIQTQVDGIPAQIDAAKSDAITTAASDAQTKAQAAQQAAIDAAAADATTKANAAKQAAIDAAALTAQDKADLAQANAIASASTDAQAKATQAKTDAINAAATDATTKATQAKNDAISAADTASKAYATTAKDDAITAAATDATNKATQAKNDAITAAATDAQQKADLAKAAAINTAASDATTKANSAQSAAIAAAVPRIFPLGSAGKIFTYPLSFQYSSGNSTSSIVIDTAVTFGNYMSKIRITGYDYAVGGATEIDVTVAGYFYTGGANGPAFVNCSQTSLGSANVTARLARKTATGTVSIILDIAGGTWHYSKILVERIELGQTTPPDSMASGWSAAFATDLSAYDLVTLPARRDINDTNSLTQSWRTTGQTTIDGGKVTADSISAAQIAANAITASELSAGAVIAGKLAANSVIAGNINTDAVTAGTIAAGAIIAGKLAADSVLASNIKAGEVVAGKLAAGAVIAGNIATDAVTAATIAAGAVTTAKLAANAVTANELAANSVVAGDLQAGAVVAGNVAANAITAGTIAANAVTAATIAAGAVTTAKILAGNVTATELATDSVTAIKVAAGAIIAGKLAADSVLAANIKAGEVVAGKLAAGAVIAGSIATGAVTTATMAAGAVTANVIAANAVTAKQLLIADGSNMAEVNEAVAGIAAGGGALTVLETDANGLVWSKRDVTSGSYFFFRQQVGPVPLKTGDRVRLTFDAFADAAFTPTPYVWIYGTSTASNVLAATAGAPTQVTTAPQSFSYEGNITVANGAATFLVGLAGATSRDLRVRNVRAYRMGAGELIVDGTIQATKIIAGTIGATQLATDAVIAAKIKAGEVIAGKLATGAVVAGNIAADAVTAGTIAAGAVVAGKIATDAVTSNTIAANAVVAGKLAVDSVLAGNIKAGEVTAGKLAALAVIAGNIAADAVTASTIKAGEVTAGKLAAGAVVAGNIAANAVTASTIAADAIDGRTITGSTIRTAASGSRWVIQSGAAANTILGYTGRADEQAPANIAASNGNGGVLIRAAGISATPPASGDTIKASALIVGVDSNDATRRQILATDMHDLTALAAESVLLQGGGTDQAGSPNSGATKDGGHISIGRQRSNGTGYARGVHISGNITLDPNFGGAAGFGGTNLVTVKGDLSVVSGSTKLTVDGGGFTFDGLLKPAAGKALLSSAPLMSPGYTNGWTDITSLLSSPWQAFVNSAYRPGMQYRITHDNMVIISFSLMTTTTTGTNPTILTGLPAAIAPKFVEWGGARAAVGSTNSMVPIAVTQTSIQLLGAAATFNVLAGTFTYPLD